MRTIGLIELYAHSEVLRTYLRVMERAGFELKVFCSQAVERDLKEDPVFQMARGELMADGESRPQFIRRCRRQLEQCDLLIFITIVSDFRFFSQLQLPAKKLLIVHNGYTFLAPRKHLHFRYPITDRLRLLRQWGKGEWYFRRKMLRNMDYLSFPTPIIKEHLQQQGLLQDYPIGPVLPFGYYEGTSIKAPKEWRNIIVPGAISEEGRNYGELCSAICKAVPELKHPIRLVLLGKIKEESLKGLFVPFDSCPKDRFELIYYNELVPQQEFDQQLQQAEFLILPLKQHLRFGIVREVYGYSNISGGINDLLRFGHAALISAHYPLEKELEGMCQRYQDENDLAAMIIQWVNNGFYQQIRKQASLLLKNYSLGERSQYFKQQVLDILP